MKVLHLNTSDLDGGAARAANRLHHGLQTNGIASQMLVRAKSSVDRSVIADRTILSKLGPIMDGLPLKLSSRKGASRFSPQWFPDSITSKAQILAPDVIHLHWICNGFLKIETLAQLHKPLVWTLHDMWVITGGCHTSWECDRYQTSCGNCPQLCSNREHDLSHWIWRRKTRAWSHLNLTLISPSLWLADAARSSSLFRKTRIEVIPHGLDLETYRPIERTLARKILNLPQDKTLIHFGSGSTGDPNKGFHFLIAALQNLHQIGWRDDIELVVFGSAQPEHVPEIGFRTHYLGRFHDDVALALLYSAADVLIVPSKQESFGQTASEALACGTPVIAFATTGLNDIVTHQCDGYLAKPFEIKDLTQGIIWVLEDQERLRKLGIYAREKAQQNFSLTTQVKRHLSLYNTLTN